MLLLVIISSFQKFPNSKGYKFVAYHNASYDKLKDKVSQGGFLIVMTDDSELKLSSATWPMKCIKHVIKRPLSAETLSIVEVLEACFWLQNLSNETFGQ